jgi:hypothetical protein
MPSINVGTCRAYRTEAKRSLSAIDSKLSATLIAEVIDETGIANVNRIVVHLRSRGVRTWKTSVAISVTTNSIQLVPPSGSTQIHVTAWIRRPAGRIMGSLPIRAPALTLATAQP